MLNKKIETKTWEEFRATGLFLFINSILHAFGWTLVFSLTDGKITSIFPARTNFRGFDCDDISQSHEQIAKYLAENAPNFPKEIQE